MIRTLYGLLDCLLDSRPTPFSVTMSSAIRPGQQIRQLPKPRPCR